MERWVRKLVTPARFLKLGFLHILPYGLDHILFVLGLLFFSIQMRPLLIQVTAFTIAHSITLGLSLVGIVSLPASIVEPLIALSIAVVAIENIFFRRMNPSRWILVFGFGLVHGMGFAGVLRGLGLPEGQFLTTLLSFNLGVELGQLAVILLAWSACTGPLRASSAERVPPPALSGGERLEGQVQGFQGYSGLILSQPAGAVGLANGKINLKAKKTRAGVRKTSGRQF